MQVSTVNSDMCSGVPGGGKGQRCVCVHPEPTRKEQQASGFREVAKFSPPEIVPWQRPPPPLCTPAGDQGFLGRDARLRHVPALHVPQVRVGARATRGDGGCVLQPHEDPAPGPPGSGQVPAALPHVLLLVGAAPVLLPRDHGPAPALRHHALPGYRHGLHHRGSGRS